MHLPIRYALGDASRLATNRPGLRLQDYARLEFFRPDTEKFPSSTWPTTRSNAGGNTACVINAANEIAVDAFLHERIGYLDIQRTIESTLNDVPFIASPGYDDYVATNTLARRIAEEHTRAGSTRRDNTMDAFLIKAAQLIAAFALLVIIHEFGHYIFARMFGIKVEKFYLFFDPWFSLVKWRPKEKGD